ncbi:MAG: indolepyruvate oxidoreductase subunit beta family protein [Quisquiliibacterium sp.]
MSQRPLTVLVLALGGEGGGVLGDWIVQTALAQGLPVQATSVPGVAQRTGATSYYVEMLEKRPTDGREPVFCLAPTPGQVDLVVSSELLETARALERGLVDPERTMLVSSTARFLTIAEKAQMADGRLDPARMIAAARELAREALFFDMAAETAAARTVLSSVMFGAIAATGALPLPRAACEATIRSSSGAVNASLAGFARGFDAVLRARAQADGVDRGAAATATASVNPPTGASGLPAQVAEVAELALARLRDYQDDRYAQAYLERVRAIVAAEQAAGGVDLLASQSAARFLALWMSYEDVIRVADLKSAPQRLAQIRHDFGAKDLQPFTVREYLKPGIEEIASILPAALASRVRRWHAGTSNRNSQANTRGKGIALKSTSFPGYFALRLLAWLKPLRRRSERFAKEQALIERWQAALLRAMPVNLELAREIAQCPRLLKGYGDTHLRGRRSFEALMLQLIEPPLPEDPAGQAERAKAIALGRDAALADPDGHALAGALGRPLPPLREQPIRFFGREARRS